MAHISCQLFVVPGDNNRCQTQSYIFLGRQCFIDQLLEGLVDSGCSGHTVFVAETTRASQQLLETDLVDGVIACPEMYETAAADAERLLQQVNKSYLPLLITVVSYKHPLRHNLGEWLKQAGSRCE